MCDQTNPVGEINQVNKILALLCAADYGFIKTNSLLFSCTPLLCKLNSVVDRYIFHHFYLTFCSSCSELAELFNFLDFVLTVS